MNKFERSLFDANINRWFERGLLKDIFVLTKGKSSPLHDHLSTKIESDTAYIFDGKHFIKMLKMFNKSEQNFLLNIRKEAFGLSFTEYSEFPDMLYRQAAKIVVQKDDARIAKYLDKRSKKIKEISLDTFLTENNLSVSA